MRRRLREIAEQTVALVEAGRYRTPAGDEVDIAAGVAAAVAGTRLYLPAEGPAAGPGDGEMTVTVTNESSLAAAHRLGGEVACLVFASARNPGGGFRSGARAQEESIARSSALYATQQAMPEFYAYHRAEPDLAYSDRVIYSPAVPVFRADDGDGGGELLARPYQVGFLTAAAPNLTAILRNQPDRAAEVPAVLRRRAARVVRVAAAHGHRRLVLGAWGCGVFGNDPATVAGAFAAALRDQPGFDQVCFAVLDRQPGAPAYAAFHHAFAAGS
jgi:uncharacterized protein (TIGR02452 family)